jgi:hypothetical protein
MSGGVVTVITYHLLGKSVLTFHTFFTTYIMYVAVNPFYL